MFPRGLGLWAVGGAVAVVLTAILRPSSFNSMFVVLPQKGPPLRLLVPLDDVDDTPYHPEGHLNEADHCIYLGRPAECRSSSTAFLDDIEGIHELPPASMDVFSTDGCDADGPTTLLKLPVAFATIDMTNRPKRSSGDKDHLTRVEHTLKEALSNNGELGGGCLRGGCSNNSGGGGGGEATLPQQRYFRPRKQKGQRKKREQNYAAPDNNVVRWLSVEATPNPYISRDPQGAIQPYASEEQAASAAGPAHPYEPAAGPANYGSAAGPANYGSAAGPAAGPAGPYRSADGSASAWDSSSGYDPSRVLPPAPQLQAPSQDYNAQLQAQMQLQQQQQQYQMQLQQLQYQAQMQAAQAMQTTPAPPETTETVDFFEQPALIYPMGYGNNRYGKKWFGQGRDGSTGYVGNGITIVPAGYGAIGVAPQPIREDFDAVRAKIADAKHATVVHPGGVPKPLPAAGYNHVLGYQTGGIPKPLPAAGYNDVLGYQTGGIPVAPPPPPLPGTPGWAIPVRDPIVGQERDTFINNRNKVANKLRMQVGPELLHKQYTEAQMPLIMQKAEEWKADKSKRPGRDLTPTKRPPARTNFLGPVPGVAPFDPYTARPLAPPLHGSTYSDEEMKRLRTVSPDEKAPYDARTGTKLLGPVPGVGPFPLSSSPSSTSSSLTAVSSLDSWSSLGSSLDVRL